jgi:nitrate reductase NapE component
MARLAHRGGDPRLTRNLFPPFAGRRLVAGVLFFPALYKRQRRADQYAMSVEDVLKLVSVILVPSIGAVVWLLGIVYGLRGDLRKIESDQGAQRLQLEQLQSSVNRLTTAVNDLTLILARNGLDRERERHV